MGDLAAKCAYLKETKTQIKGAIVAKGVAVGASDPFRSYAAKIGTIAAKCAPTYPDVTYSADHVKRFALYGATLYAEYELRTSGTLTVAAGKTYTADVMLIGPGGNGGNAPVFDRYSSMHLSVGGCGGGGAGHPHIASAMALTGGVTVTIGAGGGTSTQFGTVTAASGGNGASPTSGYTPNGTAGGTGYVGAYNLYGDATHPAGEAAAALAGGASSYSTDSQGRISSATLGHGGAGSSGCTIVAMHAEPGSDGICVSLYTNVSACGGAGGIGYGAGAGGSGGTVSNSSRGETGTHDYRGIFHVPRGAQGVVLVRIAV